jgi:TRAP-type mannitol/chloroaromatic compound transport system permease small subunit
MWIGKSAKKDYQGGKSMRGLLGLSSAIDAVNGFIGRATGWLILIAVLVSATNAVIRKLFSTSSNAWLELQWYLFGAAFLLAAAYTLRENGHVRIDVLYGRVSEKTRQWIDLLGHIFFLMPFCLLMIWYLVPYVSCLVPQWRSVHEFRRSDHLAGQDDHAGRFRAACRARRVRDDQEGRHHARV